MSGVSRWRDSGHLERAIQTAGGEAAFGAAVTAMLNDARLAADENAQESRQSLGTQRQPDGLTHPCGD